MHAPCLLSDDRGAAALSWLPRLSARCLLALLVHGLAGCASLPQAAAPGTSPVAPVAFSNANGPLSPARSRAVLDGLDDPATGSDILRRHLGHEEAINRGSPLVLGNRLTLLEDGPATYAAMFAAIRKARHHINLETYIFEDGEIGETFARLLRERQAAGVQVNLIYDSVGSLETPAAFFEELAAAGVNVLEFNPVNPAKASGKLWRLNNRDHRKLLIVDGSTAFVGGINISAAYSSGSSARLFGRHRQPAGAGWRDTHLQIDGPVVAEFQRRFLDTWARQDGPPLPDRHYFPKLARQGDAIVRAIASTADTPDSQIYQTLLSAIDHAETSIYLTNAYFVPDPALLDALARAAGRGVDVRFILPGKTDSWAVFHAGRSHYASLLEAGVRLYERRDAVLHSKTAVIDGVWSTIGSTNLDWRSFLHNDEINAVILGSDFGARLEAMFRRDLGESTEIEAQAWRRRSLWLRLQERTARLFEYWL